MSIEIKRPRIPTPSYFEQGQRQVLLHLESPAPRDLGSATSPATRHSGGALPSFPVVSSTWPVAIRMTSTALPITSALPFSPLGPSAMPKCWARPDCVPYSVKLPLISNRYTVPAVGNNCQTYRDDVSARKWIEARRFLRPSDL